MSYPVLAPKHSWYTSSFARDEITEIHILKSDSELPDDIISNGADESWIASADPLGSAPTCVRKGTLLFIVGDGSDKIQLSADASNMFSTFPEITKIEGAGLLDTSVTTNISLMCFGCKKLTSIDVSGWDTSSVTNMSSAFYECFALTSLDVSNWNTSSVTNMSGVFFGCRALTSLDVSSWNTSNVKDISGVFYDCRALTSLDVSSWDTSSATTMTFLFYNCSSLKALDVSNWKIRNVKRTSGMFSRCSSLKALDVSNWNTSNVKEMSSMFSGCSSLTQLDVSKWDTSNVTDMSYLFSGCSSLKALTLYTWDTLSVETMENMFSGMVRLEKIAFGEKFAFIDAVLPTPDPNYIEVPAGYEPADGYWYIFDGFPSFEPETSEVIGKYLPSEIPDNPWGIYCATGWAWARDHHCLISFGTWVDTCSKIREKVDTEKPYKTYEMPQAIEDVYEKGKQAEYDAFWDTFQQNGALMSYANAFCSRNWNDDCYNPKYPITSTSGTSMFYSSQITDTKVTIDLSRAAAAQTLFGYSQMKYIRKLILNENITNYSNAFAALGNLELLIVEGVIGANGVDIHWSPKLSRESIESIINALSTTTSGLSVTFSKRAVNAAFETTAGAADGSISAEWAALIATRSNWTISLA